MKQYAGETTVTHACHVHKNKWGKRIFPPWGGMLLLWSADHVMRDELTLGCFFFLFTEVGWWRREITTALEDCFTLHSAGERVLPGLNRGSPTASASAYEEGKNSSFCLSQCTMWCMWGEDKVVPSRWLSSLGINESDVFKWGLWKAEVRNTFFFPT